MALACITAGMVPLSSHPPWGPHSLLAVTAVTEHTSLKAVQGHEADVFKHVKGGHRATCQMLPPFSLEGRRHRARRHEDHTPQAGQTATRQGITADPVHTWQRTLSLYLEASGGEASLLPPLGRRTHVHGVRGLVEDLHVGFQYVKVERRREQAAVPAPLVPFADQKSIP